jgi:hypothetical protein
LEGKGFLNFSVATLKGPLEGVDDSGRGFPHSADCCSFPSAWFGLKASPKCLLSVKIATTNIGKLENTLEGAA